MKIYLGQALIKTKVWACLLTVGLTAMGIPVKKESCTTTCW